MKTCPNCRAKLGKEAVAYCTSCGHQLVKTEDLPTLETKIPRSYEKQTRILEKIRSENSKLKSEITILKRDLVSRFGGTDDPVDHRVERIMTVRRFKRSFSGNIDRLNFDKLGDPHRYVVTIPGYLRNFKLYEVGPTESDGNPGVIYVATFDRAIDFEKELADIRVLLSDGDAQDVPCTFVIATNEDLNAHKKQLKASFVQMKTVIQATRRRRYKLEVWDRDELLKHEYRLKIKIEPLTTTVKRSRKK